jgi:NADH-dependent peroxiredoxin subunit F
MNLDLSFHLDVGLGSKPKLDPDALHDVLVVGAGPAGLNAALYAARKGLDVAVLGKRKGGQLLDTSAVDNYLGVDDVDGEGLADRFQKHLAKYSVPVLDSAEVVDVAADGPVHVLVLSTGETYHAKALVVATGSTPRRLDVPGEQRFAGKGVGYCAICDGPLFAGKDVFVAGGGNSAVQAALDLAQLSRTVTIVHRSTLRADQVFIDRLLVHPKVTVLLGTRIVEVTGQTAMDGLVVEDAATGARRPLRGDGLFIEIGHLPNVGPFAKRLALSEHGEIVTDPRGATRVPGIFAAGDVTDFHYKQIVIAVGSGATAALSANEYIRRTQF